jgi:hypothetical protein
MFYSIKTFIKHRILVFEKKMSEEMTYSFIIHDISVTMDENSIKTDLMGRYNGVEKVKRMFHNDKDATPKTSVRVYFTSAADIEKIRRDGNIVIGGICRQIYEPKNSPRQYSQNETKQLCEQDLMNMFEEQKK